jgi:hypothetical protein
MGVINKEFNPINENQTDPISLKKKMEELKDGQKGAPTPSFKFFDKENAEFQTKDPMVSEKRRNPKGEGNASFVRRSVARKFRRCRG